LNLYLFRIKVFAPAQATLFTPGFDPGISLRTAIGDRPTSKMRRGVSWHIGNVEKLDSTGLYCRLGKMSKRTLPMLDRTGDFVEQEFANAPYTHVLLDWKEELCALARNPLLSPHQDGIARRLIEVLSESPEAKEKGLSFRVGPVRDPDEFLEILEAAYAIKSYSFTFTRKNLFNASDFVQPFERAVDEMAASEGKVTFKGASLDSQPIKEITASAAATGDNASARIQAAPGQRTTTKSLQGDAASVTADDLSTDTARQQALDSARGEHDRIKARG
jgi:hypothetical protein